METIKIGIVGYGYWGPNLVRNFSECPGATVVAVSDLSAERLAKAKARYPAIRTTTSVDDLLADAEIDAVVIATPVSTHFDLASRALKAGKHVLVEKPLTSSAKDAKRLIDEAEKQKRVLMVDHTFVYTGAVRKIKELVDSGAMGDIYYYDSVRVNLGLFQHDVSVMWDLAVHDLAIMDYVLPVKPVAVSATGMAHVAGQPENVAYLTMYFEQATIAHLHVNWLAPVKVRQTLIGGTRKMIVYDDLEPSEKIKVYDKGITLTDTPESVYQMMIGYRMGDMWAPQLPATEALGLEARHFVECIIKGTKPLTDGQTGWRVVRLLEAASQSLTNRGAPVVLEIG